MGEMKEVELTDGTMLRCEEIPPLALSQAIAGNPKCRKPAFPMEQIVGVAGTTSVPARPGTAEYDAFEEACAAADQEIDRIRSLGPFLLGVVSWKHSGEKKFTNKVPSDWEFPVRVQILGIQPQEDAAGRLWDYIVYELIRGADNYANVQEVILGVTLPMEKDEVVAAEDMFPGEGQPGEATTEATSE